MSAIELVNIGSASNNPVTQMLVNAIFNDDQKAADMAQGMIKARGSLNEVPQYTANVDRIASGLNSTGVQQRDNGTGFGVA